MAPSHLDTNFWLTELGDGAAHLQYNRVSTANEPHFEPIWAFAARLREARSCLCARLHEMPRRQPTHVLDFLAQARVLPQELLLVALCLPKEPCAVDPRFDAAG